MFILPETLRSQDEASDVYASHTAISPLHVSLCYQRNIYLKLFFILYTYTDHKSALLELLLMNANKWINT